MAIKTQSPRAFDDAKLAAMVEPLTVRVEKIKGTSRTPIPLPEGDDGKQGGTEWAKEDVRGLENWLVTEWAGGGLYEITVTDSSPTPNVMKWSPFWNPADYPEKLPPPLAAAARQQPTPSPSTPTPQVRMPAFPNGLPTFPTPAAPTAQPQFYPQPQFYMPQPPLPPAPTPGSPQWAAWQDAAEKRRLDEELRLMREQAAQREREAVNAKREAQLAAERQASEQRTRALEQQISELRNLMTAQNASSQKNPELEALRMQLEQQRQQAEQTRQLAEKQLEQTRQQMEQTRRDAEEARRQAEAKAEAERRDRETRELIQRQAEESRRQLEEMRRQHEATIAALTANKGPDPVLTMMLQMQQQQAEAAKEAARQNADAIKEMARQSADQVKNLQATMMTPMQAMQLVKDNAQQADGATAKVQQLFGTVIDMQQKVMENALQMQPSGSPVPGLIEKGIDTVQATIERYVGAKSTEERVKAQAQAQMVEAQSRAYIAAQQAQAGQPIVTAPPPEQGQLAGPNNVVPITDAKPKNKKKRAAAEEQPTVGSPTPAPEPVVTGDNTKRLGRTDAQWFGPLLSEVDQLRLGVDRFMESLQMEPPRLDANGQPDGISPQLAAMGIGQAVNAVMQRGVVIPAMADLLFQERFADFIDVLLPNAPQQYRDDLVQMISQAEEEEDEEPDEDPENDTEVPPPAAPTPNGQSRITH